jgi:hypothetical protein
MHYQRNVTCCLYEWRLVVLELGAGDSAWSSLMRQQRGQLAGGATSHEALPSLAFYSIHCGGSPARWWLQRASSTGEGATTNGQRGHGEQATRRRPRLVDARCKRIARWRRSTIERLCFRNGHGWEQADAR